MKVLLIYPNKVMVTRLPLGIGYLSAYLKEAGHDVNLFDTTFLKCTDTKNDEDLRASSLQVRNPDLKEHDITEKEANVYDEIISVTEAFKPDVIGVSVADPNYSFGIDLLRRARKACPTAVTIAGGATPTFEPEEVLSEDCVDIVCVGEGEFPFVELCERLEAKEDITTIPNLWIKKDGDIIRNPIRDLIDINTGPSPDWDAFDKRHLVRPLGGKMYTMGTAVVTRGCAFHCKYCANSALVNIHKGKGKVYRTKTPENAIEELARFKEKFDLNFIFFVDDIFPLHKPDFLDTFCKLYKEKVNIPFSINLFPRLVKEEPFAKLVDIGLRNVCVGLESGSHRIRKEILGREYSDDDIINALSFAHKYNIRCSSFNMIGLPTETREDIFKTIALNKRANPTSATLTFFHPYRGTELRDRCIREGLYDPTKESYYEDVYRTESHLALPLISRETLRGLLQTFQLYYKLPKGWYPLIRIAEKDSALGRFVMNKILKPHFFKVTNQGSTWDFTAEGEKARATDHCPSA